MYKTVRQGENSLQYHILPQDARDDVTGHVMKRRRTSRNRAAFVLVLTLTVGCAIVAAAVLIPVLMTSTVVALPARFQTFAVAASSVNVRPHGKYTLQGTQYIALLPVKDSAGHFNAYQVKPSLFTTSTTSTTTTTTEVPQVSTPEGRQRRTENNDPHRPHDVTVVKRGELQRPRWMPDPYMPWTDHKSGALVLSLSVASIMLLCALLLGLCLYLRRRNVTSRRTLEGGHCLDAASGTLLVEVSGDED